MFTIEPMTQDDVPEVSRVERLCFANPWPTSAYRRELRAPDQNYYVVLRETSGPAQSAVDGNGRGVTHPTGLTPLRRGANGLLPRRQLLPLPFGRRAGLELETAEIVVPPILGFAGMWILYDEAHITTIGVDPRYRGRGLGELLLIDLYDEALRRGAGWLTLEVRVSNTAAQELYRKYGFTVQGTRRRYYSDNNEDAYIMWSRSLQDPANLADVARHRRRLLDRLGYEQSAVGSRQSSAFGRQSAAG